MELLILLALIIVVYRSQLPKPRGNLSPKFQGFLATDPSKCWIKKYRVIFTKHLIYSPNNNLRHGLLLWRKHRFFS